MPLDEMTVTGGLIASGTKRVAAKTAETVLSEEGMRRKKVKHIASEEDGDDDEDLLHVVSTHPFGVQPAGNALLHDASSMRAHHEYLARSMGLFARLPNDVLLRLFDLLSPIDLAKVGRTSKALHAFASHEPLWRQALIEKTGGHLRTWCGSWKATYATHSGGAVDRESNITGKQCTYAAPVYSDELFLPIQLASLPLQRYVPTAQKPNAARGIERVDMASMSKADFLRRFAVPSIPCILKDSATDARLPAWTVDDVCKLYTGRRIRAEALSMPFEAYAAYAETCRAWDRRRAGWIPDESPFYLFDPMLARTMQKNGHFVVPRLFCDDGDDGTRTSMAREWDLFSLLHDRRPDNAWIIAGPKRSGSGWHTDPNYTSAYNTVLSGRKLWMMLPPSVTPPGVFISQDGATVTAPLSIAEWLRDFWTACVRQHGRRGDDTLHVDVCAPGETMYVPAGWKHLVVNLDESVAFTQNFVSPAELPSVLHFLKRNADQISGFRIRSDGEKNNEESDPELDELPDEGVKEKRQLFDLFVQRLEESDEQLCRSAFDAMKRHDDDDEKHVLAVKKNWWKGLSKDGAKNGGQAAVLSLAAAVPDTEELDEIPW